MNITTAPSKDPARLTTTSTFPALGQESMPNEIRRRRRGHDERPDRAAVPIALARRAGWSTSIKIALVTVLRLSIHTYYGANSRTSSPMPAATDPNRNARAS